VVVVDKYNMGVGEDKRSRWYVFNKQTCAVRCTPFTLHLSHKRI